jgi:hypothetical protein
VAGSHLVGDYPCPTWEPVRSADREALERLLDRFAIYKRDMPEIAAEIVD